MQCDRRETAYREGYPEELSGAEEKLVKISREARGRKPVAVPIKNCVGAGLSGGGIRSATFCLGMFQGLATLKMLAHFDFVSTVSGGGYFGSFYTRLFLRKEVKSFSYVEETFAHCPPDDKKQDKDSYQRNIINWLRENGRYLSPQGSGDLLLAGAVLLRNWIVVQVVIAVFFLMLFLAAQLLRIPLDPWFHQIPFFKKPGSELVINLPGQLKLWVSPFLLAPMSLFCFAALPLGWAYWLIGRQPPLTRWWDLFKRPVTGLIFVFLVALFLSVPFPAIPVGDATRAVAISLLLVSALTALWSFYDQAYANKLAAKIEEPGTESKYGEVYKDDLARNLVSAQLKGALVVTLASLAFAAVDSLGQTVYLVSMSPVATLKSWGGGVLGLLVALLPFASRIMISFGGANGAKRPRSLVKIAAAAAAFLIVATLLTTFSVGANAIAWTLRRPAYAPAGIGEKPSLKLSEAKIVPDPAQPNKWSIENLEAPRQIDAPERQLLALAGACGLTLALSLLFGQSWPFLNRSTQLPLYSSRLTRAYLGASNPRRFKEERAGPKDDGGSVTQVIPGDDIEMEHYWPWPFPQEEKHPGAEKPGEKIYANGTPLHLVNVTINETLDSKSQVQQQDRKGIGMAVGPAGISAGIRHHVVFDRESGKVKTLPKSGFRMFDYGNPDDAEFTGERFSLGHWLSISGAAFSTGLGARTNLALSILAGVGNIRLGYWWNSGVVRDKNAPENKQSCSPKTKPLLGQRLGTLFTRAFPVQSYLLDEYTARYHGTARQHWNLSDGGHFENMGGYELIRRRLRLIVIIDAEADPDYRFEGLADLIRKARIDFGAEIKFLEESELHLPGILPAGHCFSALENLRRGKWVEEQLPQCNKKEAKRQVIDPVDHQRYSLAHAAVARVSYDCKEEAESVLIYLKPTVIGDEPLDILQYHAENPSFPQQPTSDQFFDEAQWESYRRLGEHIANEVFAVFKAPDGEDETEWLDSLIDNML